MTAKGQAATQDEQPLQISGWTKTWSNSVWMMAPVGHACWQGAVTQCLQTSLIMSQRPSFASLSNASRENPVPDGLGSPGRGCEGEWSAGNCSMNFTCRQEVADNVSV